MSQVETHSRDYFYKYFTLQGAYETLNNGTFLYRAPALYNDPFDSQINLQPGISEKEIRDILFEALVKAILDKAPEPRLGLTAESIAALPPHLVNRDVVSGARPCFMLLGAWKGGLAPDLET